MLMRPDDQRANWLLQHAIPHEPVLRRYLARQCRSLDIDPEDIVQEVYGRLAEMETVTAIREPRSFLLGMARNILLMHLRRARIVPIQALGDIANADLVCGDPSPEDQAADRRQLRVLAEAINTLDEPGRSAFLLRAVHELPYAEIGSRLGMSDNAVQKSHAKTLRRLMSIVGWGGNARARATRTFEQTMRVGGKNERARDK
jgi:RNA polymerase sigma factor (sigma-70 family)